MVLRSFSFKFDFLLSFSECKIIEKNLEEVPLELSDREEITTLISSGKPNFSGSSNIQGIETLAIIGLVAVADFQAFVTAFQNLNKLLLFHYKIAYFI